MIKFARAVFDSPQSVRQLAAYVVIGAIGVGVDLGSLIVLLRAGMHPIPAVSLAFLASVVVHFGLNKYVNFRNFERSTARQMRTYLTVAVFVWLFTIAWVEFFTRTFGVPVLAAKISVMPINVAIGYLATRYLTFGPGISGGLRALRARYAKRNP